MERLIVSFIVGATTFVLVYGLIDFNDMLRMNLNLNLFLSLVFAIIVSSVILSNLKE